MGGGIKNLGVIGKTTKQHFQERKSLKLLVVGHRAVKPRQTSAFLEITVHRSRMNQPVEPWQCFGTVAALGQAQSLFCVVVRWSRGPFSGSLTEAITHETEIQKERGNAAHDAHPK